MNSPHNDDGRIIQRDNWHEIVMLDDDENADTTVRPAEERIRQQLEQFLEKLKKYSPEEYEQIMKQREDREMRKQSGEKPNTDSK